MFGSIFRYDMSEADRSPHIFTIKDTPRLPRALWEKFKAEAVSRGETTIDALRRALELYIAQPTKPTPRE